MKDSRTLILIIIVVMGLAFLAITTPGVADRLTLPGLEQPTPLVTVVVIIQQQPPCNGTEGSPDCYKLVPEQQDMNAGSSRDDNP